MMRHVSEVSCPSNTTPSQPTLEASTICPAKHPLACISQAVTAGRLVMLYHRTVVQNTGNRSHIAEKDEGPSVRPYMDTWLN